MDTALSSHDLPPFFLLSPSSLLFYLLFSKEIEERGGSEEGYYCSPQTPFVKGSFFFLSHPTTQGETHSDTERKMIFVVVVWCGGAPCHNDVKIAYEGGGAGLKICPAPLGLVSRRWFPL